MLYIAVLVVFNGCMLLSYFIYDLLVKLINREVRK